VKKAGEIFVSHFTAVAVAAMLCLASMAGVQEVYVPAAALHHEDASLLDAIL
jgi:negative regulator of sigma E activity